MLTCDTIVEVSERNNKMKTYSTDINLSELTGKIAQVRGSLDHMSEHLGGLCDKESAIILMKRANERLEKVQQKLYDVMYKSA